MAYTATLTALFHPNSNSPLPLPHRTINVYSSSTESITLGRNGTTQIRHVLLSRKLCDISVSSSGQMYLEMRKSEGSHNVMLDSKAVISKIKEKVELKEGSILYLSGDRFSYRVSVKESQGNDEANGQICAQQYQCNMIREELTCGICMEIMHKCTVVNPCGHWFCEECLQTMAQCPSCRTPMTGKVWIRHTDNIIMEMIIRGEFEMDDVMAFLHRSGKKLTKEQMNTLKSKMTLIGDDQSDSQRTKRQKLDDGDSKKRRISVVDLCGSASPGISSLGTESSSVGSYNTRSTGMAPCSDGIICLD